MRTRTGRPSGAAVDMVAAFSIAGPERRPVESPRGCVSLRKMRLFRPVPAHFAFLLLPLLVSPSLARAQKRHLVIEGKVTRSAARWTRGRTAIVTESVVRTQEGTEYWVRQLGGTVNGIGM